MKKSSFLILLSIFLHLTLSAQEPLKANAGEGEHFCLPIDLMTLKLGGNPTASGGTEPYTYRWWSDMWAMISPDTAPNPDILFLNSVTVYLEVTDAENNVAIDSMIITVSEQQIVFSASPQHLQLDYYINKGDSVFLNGNVAVLNNNSTFAWSPCESIVSNCNVADGFWAKPTVTTSYKLTATDEFDCSETFFTFFYRVFVDEVGIKDKPILDDFMIFPNPVKDILYFNEETQVEIMDSHGRTLIKTTNNVKSLNVSNLKSGIYFLKTNNGIEKFVKK